VRHRARRGRSHPGQHAGSPARSSRPPCHVDAGLGSRRRLCLGGVRPRRGGAARRTRDLEAKAQQLYGNGAKTPALVPGKGAVEGIFLADRTDVTLAYCSGAAGIIGEVPGLVAVPLPPELAVGPAYGMVLLDAKPVTLRFATFVLSRAGPGPVESARLRSRGAGGTRPAIARTYRATRRTGVA
jgi:hypothetical protein